ncbi:hypothetical protein VaNZ11_016659 [Volvox africanus]|uniref:J domain-containing protein n=1 Tax=Volvox africanus TaxID=51714 RepID=A0ABQ5SNT9_9CHLO|nr:hypothetical protein VaNZ11_016659 [Volvox africanus]
MYLAASPDAWDLLWTFPDVSVASTSLSVPSKSVVVHRVAPTDPIPPHVNASKCRPFGTSKPIARQLVGAFTYDAVTPEAIVLGCGGSAKPSDAPGHREVDAGHKTSQSVKRCVQIADENDGKGQESRGCFLDTVTSSLHCPDISGDVSGDAASAPTSSVNSLTSRSSVQSVTTLDGGGDGRRVGAQDANPTEGETALVAGDRQHKKSVSADSRHHHFLPGDHVAGERIREPLPSTELSDGSETSSSSRSAKISIGACTGTGTYSTGRVGLGSCQAADAATLAARNEMGRWISLDVITDGRGVHSTAMYGNGDPIDRGQQPCHTASEEPCIAVTMEGPGVTAAAAAATWGSESLRQFYRNRDPRRQRSLECQQQPGLLDVSEQQRQQYRHQFISKTHIPTAVSLPPGGELRSLFDASLRAPSDAMPPLAGVPAEAASGAAAGKTSLSATNATAAAADPVTTYTGATCDAAMSPPLQHQQRLPLQHTAIRRGPRTTTALLLSKVRSGVAAAAAPAVVAAARVDRDFGACEAVCVRGSEWWPRRTTVGCCKQRVGVGGGSTRRAAEGIRKNRSTHLQPGLVVYDRDMEDRLEFEASGFSSDSSSGGWGGLRCATAAAVTAKPHDRRRTATSMLDEVQRALAAAAANADTDVAVTAAVGGGLHHRKAWRLPPLLRGRFDFSTARRRGSHVAAVARGGRRGLEATEKLAEKGGGPLSRPKAMGSDLERLRGAGNGAVGGAAAACPSAGHTLAQPPGSGSRSSSSGGGGGGDDGGNGSSPALALLQALDAWRTRRARSVRKTPEALLRLGLLADLAARCPTAVLELEDFPGLPRPFTRKYGQEVLDICRNHAHLRASRAAAVGATGGGDIGGGPRTYVSSGGGGGGGGGSMVATAAAQPVFGQRLAEEGADAIDRAPRPSSKCSDDGGDDDDPVGGGEILGAHVNDAAQGCGESGDDSGGGAAEDGPVCVATINRPVGPSGDVAQHVWRMRQQLLHILGVQEGDDDRPPRATMSRRRLAPSSAAVGGGGMVGSDVCGAVGGGGSSAPASGDLTPRGRCGNADTGPLSTGGAIGSGNRGGWEVASSHMCHTSGCRAASPSPSPSHPSDEIRKVVSTAAANGDVGGAGIAEGVGPKREAREVKAAAAAAKSTAGASAAGTADAAAATRCAGKRLTPDGGGVHRSSPGKARKCGPADSPRQAATAAGMVYLGALRAATAGEAVPAGWSPLPEGCRARSGRRLALASTPSLNGAKVKCLLGYLAEAGTAAAPLLEAIVPHPVLWGSDAGGTSAPSSSAATVTGASASAAVVPAAAVAMATAAHRLGRIGGQEQLRQLRGLVEVAMPAWEVRRVLSCRTLSPAAQAVAVLRLDYGASRDTVRLAFRRLSLLVHPDKNRSSGAADAFALVSAAASRLLGGQQQK